jgi:hypothetical protein
MASPTTNSTTPPGVPPAPTNLFIADLPFLGE